MEFVETVSNAVKDVVTVSQSMAKAAKEELDLYLENKKLAAQENEAAEGQTEETASSAEAETDATNNFFSFINDVEASIKKTVENNLPQFNYVKAEEYETLENRIEELEAKLSKLVEESLDAIRNEEDKEI